MRRLGPSHALRTAALAACCAGSVAGQEPSAARADAWNEVHAIFAEHCYKCHAGEQRKGGLSLDSRAGALRGGESGAAVVAGDAAASHLIARVSAEDELERMPPKGRALTGEEVAALRAWIDAGATWPELDAAKAHSTPLALRPSTPESDAPHLVDAHIEDYLHARGLAAGVALDDAGFARRVHLDVIGLLPTREALQRFCADEAPDKRAALVDALLADDQGYAEHWISFWNDLLRNDFQGTGYIDGGRAQITGWLYDTLARNVPYDQLVRELIAPTGATSEGFIKGIVWRGDNAVVQQAPMQAAVNVSQVFLGVNLKCAACHDSFVNDWSLARTFSLANCFSEAPLSLVRCETDLGVAAGYGFLWPELGAIDGALPRAERMAAVAKLVTAPENGYFTRTIVNRVWALLMGRGLVEPLDDVEREAWHPALLDALALDFIAGGYDLRALIRMIATSEAYRWAATPAPELADAAFVFRGPSARRITAEQLYDALASLTGVGRATPLFEVPGAAQNGSFVRAWRVALDPLSKALGRTAREQVTTRRETAATTLQALELANGATLHAALREGAAALCANWSGTSQELVVELYFRGLQRVPTPDELALLAPEGEAPARAEALEDILWALVMLPEFQYIR